MIFFDEKMELNDIIEDNFEEQDENQPADEDQSDDQSGTQDDAQNGNQDDDQAKVSPFADIKSEYRKKIHIIIEIIKKYNVPEQKKATVSIAGLAQGTHINTSTELPYNKVVIFANYDESLQLVINGLKEHRSTISNTPKEP